MPELEKDPRMRITSETRERRCHISPHATSFQNSSCTLCVPMFFFMQGTFYMRRMCSVFCINNKCMNVCRLYVYLNLT